MATIPQETDADAKASTRALSNDPHVAAQAITELRQAGKTGLQALLTNHAEDIATLIRTGTPTDKQSRLRYAIDKVSGQRDAHISRLFWHRDLTQAKVLARKTGKPILSLRLLGNLDEEYSCANSRLFRTLLYANRKVRDYLDQHFVLHWSSERPAPRITIDMGDGRQIKSTITGNSAHYVLDLAGTPIDVLPGLYTPNTFVGTLRQAMTAYERCKTQLTPASDCYLQWHSSRQQRLSKEWSRLITRVINTTLQPITAAATRGPTAKPPAAAAAMPRTFGKMAIETPMLRATMRTALRRPPTGDDWKKLAQRAGFTVTLDANNLAMMRLKLGRDATAKERRLLEDAALQDTVRNEYQFHGDIHSFFASHSLLGQRKYPSFQQLNDWLYTNVFLTPKSDPWLGLKAIDHYTGIEVTK